jgi:hypothetical protein
VRRPEPDPPFVAEALTRALARRAMAARAFRRARVAGLGLLLALVLAAAGSAVARG